MKGVLKRIYKRCKTPFVLKSSDSANDLYTEYHDEVMNYMVNDKYENCYVSIKSKSKGLSLRNAGIISLLRNSVTSEELPSNQEVGLEENDNFDATIIRKDYEMALKMTKYSLSTSFKLSENVTKKTNVMSEIENKKVPTPDPENFTIEYGKNNHNFLSYIVTEPLIKIGMITGAKKYPCIKDASGVVESGKPVAMKFLRGLSALGLGNITPMSH